MPYGCPQLNICNTQAQLTHALTAMGASKSKVNRITARDKAILEVKVQRDRLKQYQKKVNYYIQLVYY